MNRKKTVICMGIVIALAVISIIYLMDIYYSAKPVKGIASPQKTSSVIVLVDTSGSMESKLKDFNALENLQTFLDIDTGTNNLKMKMYVYDNKVTMVEKATLKNLLERSTLRGYNNVGQGLKTAVDNLDNQADIKKILIVTDGGDWLEDDNRTNNNLTTAKDAVSKATLNHAKIDVILVGNESLRNNSIFDYAVNSTGGKINRVKSDLEFKKAIEEYASNTGATESVKAKKVLLKTTMKKKNGKRYLVLEPTSTSFENMKIEYGGKEYILTKQPLYIPLMASDWKNSSLHMIGTAESECKYEININANFIAKHNLYLVIVTVVALLLCILIFNKREKQPINTLARLEITEIGLKSNRRIHEHIINLSDLKCNQTISLYDLLKICGFQYGGINAKDINFWVENAVNVLLKNNSTATVTKSEALIRRDDICKIEAGESLDIYFVDKMSSLKIKNISI